MSFRHVGASETVAEMGPGEGQPPLIVPRTPLASMFSEATDLNGRKDQLSLGFPTALGSSLLTQI